ncbi:MAG: hypothetical protein SGI87_11775 [Flavobacteriales bacterium]|nr:hypothetical protein [Flavobacteriales bacterium]
MSDIKNIDDLNVAIIALQNQRKGEANAIKEEFGALYENLKPINLIKNTVKDFIAAPDLKKDLVNISMSMVAGYLSKKWAVGSSDSKVKQILGSFLQMGVSSFVSQNSDGIKSKFSKIYSSLFPDKTP